MKSNEYPSVRYPGITVVLTGIIATVAIMAMAALGLTAQYREIDRTARRRFTDTGALYAHTLARLAEQYLSSPERYPIELFALAQTSGTIPGSVGVTITSAAGPSSRDFEFIWASSEPQYRTTSGELRYEPGRTRVEDELTARMGALIAGVNREAELALTELTPRIEKVTRSILELLMRNPSADQAELAEVDEIFRVLYQQGSDILAGITRDNAGTLPALQSQSRLPAEVLFFHPVAAIDRSGGSYYAGMIRFRRNTNLIGSEISRLRAVQTRLAMRRTILVLVIFWMVLLVMITVVTIKQQRSTEELP